MARCKAFKEVCILSNPKEQAQIEKKSFDGSTVKILGETFEPGKPAESGSWRQKFETRVEMLRYLQYGERYWGGEDYGSEKRKKPA